MFGQTQMIFVLDDPIPEHIRQTFRLTGESRNLSTDLVGIEVAQEGDGIDMRVAGYVVVYANNGWHSTAATNLYQQLHSLRTDAPVLMLPVEIETTKTTDPFSAPSFPGGYPIRMP